MPPASPVPGWASGDVCNEMAASRRMPSGIGPSPACPFAECLPMIKANVQLPVCGRSNGGNSKGGELLPVAEGVDPVVQGVLFRHRGSGVGDLDRVTVDR